ncbi:MAG: hypothetical protein AAFP90_19915, partial [Planctomycetota bacterium]
MKNILAIVAATVAFSVAAGTAQTSTAGYGYDDGCVQRVVIGYKCECRNVTKRVGLFKCRTRCVAQ